jgi:hypothetical protein
MKYMHSIIRGQRKSVISEIEKRFKLAGIGGQAKVEADTVLKKEFYIEIDSEALIVDIRQILRAICKEKEVKIQGGLFEEEVAKVRQKTNKSINVVSNNHSSTKVVVEPIIRDYQIWEKVIILLSNHRSPVNPAIPVILTKQQLLALLASSLSPDYPQDKLSQELESTLKELEAQGEIYVAAGNQFCIAQPTVLYKEALFRGDRAYLHLAHQGLGQPVTDSAKLVFADADFNSLKEKFAQEGISLI